MTSSSTLADAPQLRRVLSFRDVVLYFVTTGTNLQWVATAAAAGPSSIIVWIIGALVMFMPLSVCVVYLSSQHPDHGGLYVWSKRAFGPFAGFMTGWTYWTSNLPYFPGLLYFAAGNALFLTAAGKDSFAASPAYFIGFALLGLIFATVLNIRGLGQAKWLNNAGAIARSAAIVLLIVLGLVMWSQFGSASVLSAESMRPQFGLEHLIFWSTIAFALTGPESASFMGGEIRNPERTVPRALATAAPAILAIYILGTLSVLVAIPTGETSALYGVMEAINRAGERLDASWLAPLAALLVTISCMGSVGAWLGSVARIPFVAGLDSFLPRSFATLHPKYGSPATALIVQASIAALFIFLGQAGTTVKGAYDVLVSMMVIAVLLPFLFLFASAIKLAARAQAESASAARLRWFVILAACVGLLTTIISIVLAGLPRPDDPNKALAVAKVLGGTFVMVGLGVAIYVIGTYRARRSEPKVVAPA